MSSSRPPIEKTPAFSWELEDIKRSLLEGVHEIKVEDDVAKGARRALERMIAVPRD